MAGSIWSRFALSICALPYWNKSVRLHLPTRTCLSIGSVFLLKASIELCRLHVSEQVTKSSTTYRAHHWRIYESKSQAASNSTFTGWLLHPVADCCSLTFLATSLAALTEWGSKSKHADDALPYENEICPPWTMKLFRFFHVCDSSYFLAWYVFTLDEHR